MKQFLARHITPAFFIFAITFVGVVAATAVLLP